jgi:SAM-dependent methyltransferase
MSAFSAVDEAPDPGRLVAILDHLAVGQGAMKHYMAAAHALRRPAAPVLDLGCGAGHNLAVLERHAVQAVGVDPSTVMLGAAGERGASPLARACGEHLPFADGAFAGCLVERVLMHVADPAAVIGEVVRCVRPGGLLTIFEPDWSSLEVNGSPVPPAWLTPARHPAVGFTVGGLIGAAGCEVLDRVEERSWWDFAAFERVTNPEQSLARAVARSAAPREEADRWLAEQKRRGEAGDFRAEIAKVLWVAVTPC